MPAVHDYVVKAQAARRQDTVAFFKENPVPSGYKICTRCDGDGILFIYGHVCGGVCFRCKGRRIVKDRQKKTKQHIVVSQNVDYDNLPH